MKRRDIFHSCSIDEKTIVKVVLFSPQQKESQNPQQNIILNVKDFTKQLIKTNGH